MKRVVRKGQKNTIVDEMKYSGKHTYVVNTDAELTLVLLSSKTSRFQVTVELAGRGARAQVIGFIITSKNTDITMHTLQHHRAPETSSNLLVKCVLSDDAKFYYDGAIRVDPIAQKTDAYQRNENLLLSEHAHAESKPALEILANDVRCTHGATVGPVSQDQLWYLASRGVRKSVATHLITWGFLASALSRISDTIVRNRVEKIVWKTLSKLRV